MRNAGSISQGDFQIANLFAVLKSRVRKVWNFSQGYVSDFELVQSLKLAGSLEVTAGRDLRWQKFNNLWRGISSVG